MKLLVVGHTYVTSFSQAKYVAMKKLEPGLRLRLIVPHEVPHMFMNYKPEIHAGLEPEEVVPLPTILNKSHMTYILDPARLAALMKTFNPHHIHIEEDPHSLAGVEAVFLASRVCRQATISLFVWDNLARTPSFPLNVIKAVFSRYSFARCELVVCGNADGQRLLIDAKGFTGASLVLPQVGLDPDEYMVPLALNLADLLAKRNDAPLIGFLGRMVPEKGVLLLLEALLRLQGLKWRLLLVGNGPLKETIRNQWRKKLGDRLIMLDAVPHNVVSQYLRSLDVFVLPSYSTATWKEQFGLTLAQAMLAGVACIGSSCGAIPDVLGTCGLIFRERDVDDLAYSLKRMLQSEVLRRQLGDKARALALQRYTNTAVASAYLMAFKSLLATT